MPNRPSSLESDISNQSTWGIRILYPDHAYGTVCGNIRVINSSSSSSSSSSNSGGSRCIGNNRFGWKKDLAVIAVVVVIIIPLDEAIIVVVRVVIVEVTVLVVEAIATSSRDMVIRIRCHKHVLDTTSIHNSVKLEFSDN